MFEKKTANILIDAIKDQKPKVVYDNGYYSCEVLSTKISVSIKRFPEGFLDHFFDRRRWHKMTIDGINVREINASDFSCGDIERIQNAISDLSMQQRLDEDPNRRIYNNAISKIKNENK